MDNPKDNDNKQYGHCQQQKCLKLVNHVPGPSNLSLIAFCQLVGRWASYHDFDKSLTRALPHGPCLKGLHLLELSVYYPFTIHLHVRGFTFVHHLTHDHGRLYVQAFLTFLGERRALNTSGARLKQEDAIVSVQKIIAKCKVGFEQLDNQSPLALLLKKIADACYCFLAQAESASSLDFYIALGGLRAHLADATSQLSVIYNITGISPTAALPPGYGRLLAE